MNTFPTQPPPRRSIALVSFPLVAAPRLRAASPEDASISGGATTLDTPLSPLSAHIHHTRGNAYCVRASFWRLSPLQPGCCQGAVWWPALRDIYRPTVFCFCFIATCMLSSRPFGLRFQSSTCPPPPSPCRPALLFPSPLRRVSRLLPRPSELWDKLPSPSTPPCLSPLEKKKLKLTPVGKK